jgi:hypothetical protein
MKAIIKVILLCVITTISYSQNKKVKKSTSSVPANNTEMQEVVVINSGKNALVYVRDNNVDLKVTKLQDTFMAYNIDNYKEVYGADFIPTNIQISFELESGDGKLLATYNEKRKLISVVENYDDVALPYNIARYVYKEYPGWQIVSDKYNYTQESGEITKKEYKFTMTKDNKTKKIKVNPVDVLVAIR